VRGFVAAKGAREIILDLLLGIAAVLIAELHADAGVRLPWPLWESSRSPGRQPQFLFLAHQVQQHEHFVANR